jgi:hypothetical protein
MLIHWRPRRQLGRRSRPELEIAWGRLFDLSALAATSTIHPFALAPQLPAYPSSDNLRALGARTKRVTGASEFSVLRRWATDHNEASDQVIERKSRLLIAAPSVAGGDQAKLGTFWRVEGAKPGPYTVNLHSVTIDDCCSILGRNCARGIRSAGADRYCQSNP